MIIAHMLHGLLWYWKTSSIWSLDLQLCLIMIIPPHQGHCKWSNKQENKSYMFHLLLQTETTEKMCEGFSYYLKLYWSSSSPLALYMCSQRGPGQTITLPIQMSFETDVLGSCANSPLFLSATPVSHPGDGGELREHHLLRGKHHCWNNPLQTAILLPYGTPLSVCSAKTKTQSCDQRLELFPEVFFFFCINSADYRYYHSSYHKHTTPDEKNKEIVVYKFFLSNITAWRVILKPHRQPYFHLKGILFKASSQCFVQYQVHAMESTI